MSNWRAHPPDTTLMLALDRELPLHRRVALDQHLQTCAMCRSRADAIATTAREATRACRDGACDDPPSTGALRSRLQQQMTELGAEWERSLIFRFLRAAGAVPAVARVGITMALLLLVVRLVQPQVRDNVVPHPLETESLPNGDYTPGATSSATITDLCSGSGSARRVVDTAIREQVLQQYRMEHVAPSEYELDYLITPELGGAAEARNLWPERYDSGVWNAGVKDDLERLLPRLVCDGSVDLAVAQREIAGNWIEAYKKYFNTEHPVPRLAGFVDDDDDEILFESAADTRIARAGSTRFLQPVIGLSVKFATSPVSFPARYRSVVR